jgi:hypothetical protein
MTEIQIRVEPEKSLGEGMALWGITGCSFYGFFFPTSPGTTLICYMFGICLVSPVDSMAMLARIRLIGGTYHI